eukprot:NODE_915_length_3084_cov_1.262894.p1 type:complete len:320 gc:universal NODE_915_length_3084_cov_1.262894:1378-419(-)
MLLYVSISALMTRYMAQQQSAYLSQQASTLAFAHPPNPFGNRGSNCAPLNAIETAKSRHWALGHLNTGSSSIIKKTADYIYPEEGGKDVNVYLLGSGFTLGRDEYLQPVRRVDLTGTTPDDLHCHGSYIASLIAGKRYGVAKHARIVSVKVISPKSTLKQVIDGLDYVIEDIQLHQKSAVVQLSFNVDEKSRLLNQKIAMLTKLGAVVVKAAGNEQDAMEDTVNLINNIVVVGAVDRHNRVSKISDSKIPHIYAPEASRHKDVEGTAAAAAYVAGVAAIYLSLGEEDVSSKLLEFAHLDKINSKVTNNRIANNIPPHYQ